MKRIVFSGCIVAVFFLAVIGIVGQGTSSRVTGVVSDSLGSVVAGARVVLTNQGTGVSLETTTNESGFYTFDLVQAATYQVTVEKQGFKKFVSSGNMVNINVPATINLKLEVGDISAVVNVESSVEQVQTSSSGNIGASIDQRTLESLPVAGLRGRNPLDLLNYQPGFVSGANTGGGTHVHGSRDRAFNFTLDGIDINDSSAGGSNFTPLRPNPDSIQEFQFVSSNFSAELGRSSGAQVTFVTKPGTNDFHGNVFDFYQSPVFNANEYTNNFTGVPRNQFVQHIFGGSIGGPLPNFGFGEGTPFKLLKDKAFFFVNLEMLRAYDTALVTRTVYTQAARTGLFRFVNGGQNLPAGTTNPSVDRAGNSLAAVCTTATQVSCIRTYNIAGPGTGINVGNTTGIGLDPSLLAVINAMPLPNDFSVGDGLNTAGFNFASPQHEKQYNFTSRFDFKIADNNQLYFRFSKGEQTSLGDSVNGGRPIFPDSPNIVDTTRDPSNLAINWRFSPKSNLTNEFVFGFNNFGYKFATAEPDANFAYTFNTIATPNINLDFVGRRLRTIQFVDNLTYITGNHIFKFGANIRFGRQVDDRSAVAGSQIEGVVSFGTANTSFTAFTVPAAGTTSINNTDRNLLLGSINNLLGRFNSISRAFVSSEDGSAFLPAGSRWKFQSFFPEYDFYIQDSWRVKSNLVFDLGLRYEAKLAPTSNGKPVLAPSTQVNFATAQSNTLSWTEKSLYAADRNNFGPSIGFAWDPFKDGKTSIRANYRLNFDRIPTQVFANSIWQGTPGNNTGPTITTFTAGVDDLLRYGIPFNRLIPPQTPLQLRTPTSFSTTTNTLFDSDFQFPEVHSWSASFQREIGKGFVVEATYIGKRGTHLFGGYDANQVNIYAKDSRFGESFFDAFMCMYNQARGGATACSNGTNNSQLINFIFTGNATNNAGSTTFRGITAVANALSTSLSAGFPTGGGAANAALAVSQRTCSTADVTAAICTAAGQQLLTQTLRNGSFLQKYPQFTGGLNILDSNDVSLYNALELSFKRRMTRGLGFQVSYVLSKSRDTRSYDPTFTTVSRGSVQSASSTPFDNNDRSLNYAWSDFDRRHALQGTFVYELPIGKGKMIGGDMAKALDFIVGGWQIAGGLNLASGRPFTVYSGLNTLSNVVSSTANCNGCTRNSGTLIQELGTNYWFDAATRANFSAPNPGEQGNTGRNFFIAPYQFGLDTSLSKKFSITERIKFDLRVDAKNLTNTPNFAAPNAVLNSGTAPFGRIRDSVTNSSRRIQLSGKISF
jgi:hypothetical protein